MNLGEHIYRLRTQKNMSQGDLADALEVSRQSVSKWENNSAVPELEKLVKMAGLFGVSLDELVGSSPAKTEYPPVEICHSPVPVRSYAGLALLCCSILSLVLFLVFGEEHRFLYDCIFYVSVPLGVASAFCLVPGEHRKKLLITIAAIIGLIAAAWLIVHMPPLIEHIVTSTEEAQVQPVEPDPSIA